jgi:hypothetical protein
MRLGSPITQRRAPGAHTRSTQAPSTHDWLVPQGIGVKPVPRALHTSRTPETQRTSVWRHSRGTQRPPAAQYCMPARQSVSAMHSTQKPWVVSHTRARSLHCLEVVQGRGRSTQRLSRHVCVMGQSPSTLQSTHTPRARLHTCPGHCRELVQLVSPPSTRVASAWASKTSGTSTDSGASKTSGRLTSSPAPPASTATPVSTTSTAPPASDAASEPVPPPSREGPQATIPTSTHPHSASLRRSFTA